MISRMPVRMKTMLKTASATRHPIRGRTTPQWESADNAARDAVEAQSTGLYRATCRTQAGETEVSMIARGAGSWNTSRSTIRCIHVVPHFG